MAAFTFRALLATALAACFSTYAWAQTLPRPARPDTARQKAYRSLTDTRRSFTNFNCEVVRGLAATSDGSEVFAINSYESTLLKFAGLAPQPVAHWRTLTNPVAIAFDGPDLLVVGQGDHALARHDRASGAIRDLLRLRS